MNWHPLPGHKGDTGIVYQGGATGNGPPLWLLHGFTGHGQSLEPVSRILSQQFSLLAIDLPGHGRTRDIPDPNAKFEEVLADLHDAVRRWRAHPLHMVGYSMGGRVALGFAFRFPDAVASLTLLGASPGIADPAQRQERSVLDRDLARYMVQTPDGVFERYWESQPLFGGSTPAGSSGGSRAASRNTRRGWARSLGLLGTGSQPSYWHHLPHLHRPVQLIAGASDHKFRRIAEAMSQRLPNSRLRTVPNAGHRVHLDNPRATANLVAAWALHHDAARCPKSARPFAMRKRHAT